MSEQNEQTDSYRGWLVRKKVEQVKSLVRTQIKSQQDSGNYLLYVLNNLNKQVPALTKIAIDNKGILTNGNPKEVSEIISSYFVLLETIGFISIIRAVDDIYNATYDVLGISPTQNKAYHFDELSAIYNGFSQQAYSNRTSFNEKDRLQIEKYMNDIAVKSNECLELRSIINVS